MRRSRRSGRPGDCRFRALRRPAATAPPPSLAASRLAAAPAFIESHPCPGEKGLRSTQARAGPRRRASPNPHRARRSRGSDPAPPPGAGLTAGIGPHLLPTTSKARAFPKVAPALAGCRVALIDGAGTSPSPPISSPMDENREHGHLHCGLPIPPEGCRSRSTTTLRRPHTPTQLVGRPSAVSDCADLEHAGALVLVV